MASEREVGMSTCHPPLSRGKGLDVKKEGRGKKRRKTSDDVQFMTEENQDRGWGAKGSEVQEKVAVGLSMSVDSLEDGAGVQLPGFGHWRPQSLEEGKQSAGTHAVAVATDVGTPMSVRPSFLCPEGPRNRASGESLDWSWESGPWSVPRT